MTAEQTIKSPLPGIFYHRSNPQAEPYVKEGDGVKAGDTVGLVEVMKTFFEVHAESAGTVQRILVPSGEPVEAGQDIVVLSS